MPLLENLSVRDSARTRHSMTEPNLELALISSSRNFVPLPNHVPKASPMPCRSRQGENPFDSLQDVKNAS